MKKTIKTAMFAFAVVAAGFGGYKSYNAYTVNESTLMAENIEALSDEAGDGGTNLGDLVDCSNYGDSTGKCSYYIPCNTCQLVKGHAIKNPNNNQWDLSKCNYQGTNF